MHAMQTYSLNIHKFAIPILALKYYNNIIQIISQMDEKSPNRKIKIPGSQVLSTLLAVKQPAHPNDLPVPLKIFNTITLCIDLSNFALKKFFVDKF